MAGLEVGVDIGMKTVGGKGGAGRMDPASPQAPGVVGVNAYNEGKQISAVGDAVNGPDRPKPDIISGQQIQPVRTPRRAPFPYRPRASQIWTA